MPDLADTAETPRRLGRPPNPPGTQHDASVLVRLTAGDHARLVADARSSGRTYAAIVRRLLRRRWARLGRRVTP